MRNLIYNLIYKYNGNWNSIYNAIAKKEEVQITQSAPNDAIFITDIDYLDKFKTMYLPPFALFVNGNKELLNKKIFGILGKIDLKLEEELVNLTKNKFVICTLFENITENNLKYFLNKGIKFILIKKNKLTDDIIKHNNLLFLSENDTNSINNDSDQYSERILYNLSDSVYIKSNIEKDAKILFQNYKNNKKDCYLIIDTKLTEFTKNLVNQGVLKKINNLKEITEPPLS